MSVNLVTIQGDSISSISPPQNDSIKKGVVLPGTYKKIPTKLIVDNDIMSKHLLLIGGTGCGKTNVFNYFVKQLKQTMSPDDIMFVFDTKGDFYSQFYKQGDIVIGNSKMYSSITLKWNIYKEILVDGWDDNDIYNNACEITYSLFKEAIERTSQQFFPNAARDILTAILIAHIRLGKDSIDFRKKFLFRKVVVNMKKFLVILMFLLNALGFSALKNGIYSVEKRYDGNWNSFVKLTVRDGKIIGAQYDRKNQNGELFSMSQNSFRDIALEISRSLINSQSVSSVTGKDAKAVSEFKEMSNFLIDKANNGETGDFQM